MTTLETVQAIYAGILGRTPEEIDVDVDVYGLGGDSVQAVQIALELEMRFAVAVPMDVFEASSDARSAAAWIEAQPGAATG